jgi:hypothetical protein
MLYSAAVVHRLQAKENPYTNQMPNSGRQQKLAANLPASLQQVRAMRMRASHT